MPAIMRLLPVTALALLLSACVSGGRIDSNSDTARLWPATDPLLVPGSLPDLHLLPMPRSLPEQPRSSSAAETLLRQGDEAISSGGTNSFTEPTALTLSPVAGELGFAIYGFALPEQTETIGTIAVSLLELSELDSCFIAVSNYERDRWEYLSLPAQPAGAQLIADTQQRSSADYASPGGSFFIAVLAFDDVSLSIDEVTVVTGLPLLPPEDVSTNGIGAQETLPERIEISWTPAPGAEGYNLYARLAADTEAEFTFVDNIPGAASSSYQHLKENPNFFAPHNQDIEYRLKSVSGAEESLLFSDPAFGLRSIPPPLSVSALDQAHSSLIFLNWSAVPGAVSYFVHLDSSEDPVAETSDTFVSVSVEDTLPHHFHVRTMGVDGQGRFATSTTEPARCISWEVHALAPAGIGNAVRPVLAVIAGRPAIAFSDGVNGGVHYARSTVSEPDEAADWLVSSVASGAVPFRMDMLEHAGKPWIVYYDGDADVLCAAYADDAEPSSSTDWNSYSILEADIASHGIRLAEINGLLRFVYQDSTAQGGMTLIYYALSAEPASSEDWALDVFAEDVKANSAFDIAQIAGGTAIVYQSVDAVYLWTAETRPDEFNDWTSCPLPTVEGLNSYREFDLLAAPDGKPSLLGRYRLFGGPEQSSRVFQASVELPQTDSDWTSADCRHRPDICPGSAHSYFLDRALFSIVSDGSHIGAAAALGHPAQDDESAWAVYNIEEELQNHDFGGPMTMAGYAGRPALVYTQDNGASVFIRYARVAEPLE